MSRITDRSSPDSALPDPERSHGGMPPQHPIHIHLVQFEVVARQDMTTGAVIEPEPWETGRKDTVIAYPDQITRVKARFEREGLYVWHCHILEHEDNEMMRPYCVGHVSGPAPAQCDLWDARAETSMP